jgi:hypothetical protein
MTQDNVLTFFQWYFTIGMIMLLFGIFVEGKKLEKYGTFRVFVTFCTYLMFYPLAIYLNWKHNAKRK